MALRTPGEKGGKGHENELIPSDSSASSAGAMKGAEKNPGQDKQGAVGALEEGLVKGGLSALGSPAGSGALSVLQSFFSSNKRKTTAGGFAVTVIMSLLFFFSAGQGPLQFAHLAQLLQKFHFSSNENFGNDRASKVLLYKIAGAGAQNGRLGVLGNYAANRWEKRLLDDHGLRPVYQDPNRRFVGFEIVDDNKAQNTLGDISDQNSHSSRNVQNSMGDGAEIRTAGEVSQNGNNTTFVNGDGTRLPNDRRFVDLRSVDFGDRRAWVRTIGRATSTTNIASTVASRLLIKRFGVTFHPMNKLIGKLDEARRKRIEDKRNKNISEGVKSDGGVRAGASVDSDGDGSVDSPAVEDLDVEEETRNYINEFRNSGVVRIGAGVGAGATVVVGVLCAAKGFGDGVEDYKYQNNVLPMTRLGMDAITRGNQVMSGDDLDLDTLRVFTQYLYDEETKSSWTQARSVRAELGKDGGKPIPPEADLKNATDKPKFFDVLDDIPLLGTTCSVVDGFFNLPVIKQVSGVINSVTQEVADAALSLGNTSTDELMESALKVVSGKSVDPEAKGADFGNFANTGAFLAANDNALSMGGAPLSNAEVAELDELEASYEKQDSQTRSFASRYLDITDPTSMLGSAFLASPSSFTQLLSSFTSPFNNIFSNLSFVLPKTSAATQYNYGVPKYGFSVSEMSQDRFENPYENAAVVEPKLDELNEEYGECFGIRITSSGIESVSVGDEELNMFKRKNKCDPAKNDDIMYLRYRFYIADVVTATSLACYEGNDEACGELGASSASTGGGGGSGSGASTGELAWPDDGRGDPLASCYGQRWGRLHTGIDVGNGQLGANVTAADGGEVVAAGATSGYDGFGNIVLIKHTDNLYTMYAHNESVEVSIGDQVSQGDVIAGMGGTGGNYAIHIHFNVQTSPGTPTESNTKDPLDYLPHDGRPSSGTNCPSGSL